MEYNTSIIENENTPKRKKPPFLIVLLVLSSLNIFISMFGIATNIGNGPLTQTEIDAGYAPIKDAIQKLEESANDAQLEATLNNMYTKFKSNSEYKNFQVFYAYNWLTLLSFIIGAIGIFLLFSLRKLGLHFYLIYSLAPILITYVLLPSYLVLTYQVIMTALLTALFGFLYGLHLKFMR